MSPWRRSAASSAAVACPAMVDGAGSGMARPATTSSTRSAAAARRWVASPSRSSHARDAACAGRTPAPASSATTTTAAPARAASTIASTSARTRSPAAARTASEGSSNAPARCRTPAIQVPRPSRSTQRAARDGLGERVARLDRRPRAGRPARACAAMRAAIDGSARVGGGHVADAAPAGRGERLGVGALARAGAADDERRGSCRDGPRRRPGRSGARAAGCAAQWTCR